MEPERPPIEVKDACRLVANNDPAMNEASMRNRYHEDRDVLLHQVQEELLGFLEEPGSLGNDLG